MNSRQLPGYVLPSLGRILEANSEVVRELRESWLPHVSDAGLDRVIDLLE